MVMGALKAILKLMFVLVVAASIAGVVMLVKRPKDSSPSPSTNGPTCLAILSLSSPSPHLVIRRNHD